MRALLMVMFMVLMCVVVVCLVRFCFEEVGVDVELGVQVEAAQIKYVGNRHFAKMHGFLRRTRVHVGEAVHERLHFVGTDQIGFADKYLVGKTNLAARLLALVKLSRAGPRGSSSRCSRCSSG